ncbi:MAG: gliding motility-associated C-terminal domain-containing protein, partial [Flavobacteriales bacterium]
WTNSSGDILTNNQDVFSLTAGIYNVNVTDVIGCSENYQYEITQPDTSIGFEFVTTDYFGFAVSCPESSDGSIDISVTGGMEPYFYSWQSNAISTEFDEDQVDLTTGLYQVLIIDANYCTYTSEPILLLSTPAIGTSPSTVVNNICFGECEGSIDITPSDTGFVYSWTGVNGFTSEDSDVSGLCSGDYTVSITNSYNCSASFDFEVTEPESDAILIDASYNCDEGYADLCAFIQSVNGPFTYEWNTLDTTSCISVVGASEFCVSVTDANGCVNQNCFTTNPLEPIQVTSSITPTTCNNCNGGIDLQTNGGTGVITFTWSNGINTEDQNDLCAGSYTVSIADEASCIIERTIEVESSVGMVVSPVINDISCVNLSDGSGSVIISGGLAPIITQWYDADDTLIYTGENISNLTSGNYQVVVTSADGCIDSTDFVIQNPTAIALQITLSQFGNYNLSLFEAGDGSIEVTAIGGAGGYQYQWNPAIAGDTVNFVENLAAGDYELTVQDSNGCKVDTLIKLLEPFKLEVYNALSPNGDGINDFYIIDGSWACSESVFKVFNRWGSIVYEKKDYQDDWFGQHSDGSLLSDGTYFIIYEGCDKEFNTFVDLRRN